MNEVQSGKLSGFGFGLCNLTRSRRGSIGLFHRRLGRRCLGFITLLLDLFDAEPWHENTAYDGEGGSGHSCIKGLQWGSSVSFTYMNLHRVFQENAYLDDGVVVSLAKLLEVLRCDKTVEVRGAAREKR